MDESFGYNEVRVIFDRYVEGSLKTQTRIGRRGAYSTVYRENDETRIDNIENKGFLSPIERKNGLTFFLSKKVNSALSERSIRKATVYNTTCDKNIPDLDPAFSNDNQEEADASIGLHVIDVTQRNSFSALTISCSTVFCTREYNMLLQPLAERLDSNVCKGLLGFHALTGSDQTVKFFGFSELTCWGT